jgi:hypothetical protein
VTFVTLVIHRLSTIGIKKNLIRFFRGDGGGEKKGLTPSPTCAKRETSPLCVDGGDEEK